MREAVSYAVKAESDHEHRELTPNQIFELFIDQFEDVNRPYSISEVHFKQHNGIIATVTTQYKGKSQEVMASGNGRLDSVANALKKYYRLDFNLEVYEEHALEKSSSSRAIAYVGIRNQKTDKLYWGAGVDVDIIRASINALLTAVNNMVTAEQ